MQLTLDEITRLSPDERLALIAQLWDSLDDHLAGSFVLAWILNREMGLDPVSAYFAATAGGLDSVAAVAAELQGDTAVILTAHFVRLLCVLIFGPWLVRACSRWPSANR
jgi:uncharacterized membrane protein AbrB (regulator of aidB expression)